MPTITKMKFAALFTMGVLLAVLILAPGTARAEYPEKPVTVIVPWKPGGGTDVLARAVTPIWEKELGQPIIVVNKPGGNNIVGYKSFLDTDDDGYTMVLGQGPNVSINMLFQNAPYKTDDMHFINLFQKDVFMFYVNKEAPWQTLEDLIADAKKRPGEIKLGTVVVKSIASVFIKEFEEKFGIKFGGMIPMGGGGTLRREVVGGHLMLAAHGAWVARGGKGLVRGLGVRALERSPIWPEAQAFNELLPDDKKYTKDDIETLPAVIKGFAVHASLKTKHPERFAKLVSSFEAAMKTPEWAAMIKKHEMESAFQYFGPDQTKKVIDSLTKILKENKAIFEGPGK